MRVIPGAYLLMARRRLSRMFCVQLMTPTLSDDVYVNLSEMLNVKSWITYD